MISILEANNITSFDPFLARLKFYIAVSNDHLLNLLVRRYIRRNPTASSIMGQIARLELEERENLRIQAGHSTPNRPTSLASTPSTPSTP